MSLLCLAIGLAAGLLSGLFGIGGGIIIVPALLLEGRMQPSTATGTSLGALLLPVGALYFAVYYFTFRWCIARFDLMTPGRGATAETAGPAIEFGSRAEAIVAALGGAANLRAVDACTTRLRLELAQRYLVQERLPISKVAWLLGYQEVGAFSHAFRRWTGKPPSEVARGRVCP
jgi:glucose-like phosphotransferase system IIB component